MSCVSPFNRVGPFDLFLNSPGKIFVIILFLPLAWGCQRISPQELQDAINPLNAKNHPLAIQLLNRLLLTDPRHPKINYYLAYAHLGNNDHSKVLHFIDQTLDNDKGYKAVIGDTTMANFLAGNSDSSSDPYFRLARLELEKIISKNPDTEISERIQYHLAYYYSVKNDYEEAIQKFEKVYSTPPHDTEYDQDALLMILKILLWTLDKDVEGQKTFDLFMDRYSDKPKAAEALYIAAEYNVKKMSVFQKRYRALSDFAERWKGDQSFGPEADMALEQARRDLKTANEYKRRAMGNYNKILSDFVETRLHSLVNLKLAQL